MYRGVERQEGMGESKRVLCSRVKHSSSKVCETWRKTITSHDDTRDQRSF